MEFLQLHIEALIFCASNPVTEEELRLTLNEMFDADIPLQDILDRIELIKQKYDQDIYPFSIVKIANGYQFLTKPAYQASIGILLKQKSKKRLSTSALETLAIIAYKQPISKSQIEQIRGVNCEYAVHKLLEKELIEIKGKADTVGKPVLYGTTSKFMEYFGINDLSSLPQPKDLIQENNSIGNDEAN